MELVIESFPYFQSARALYLKGLYNQDSYKYNFVLKQTAAHTIDRSVLFDFITSDEFTIIDRNVYERKLQELMQMDVHSSEVITETFQPDKIEEIQNNEVHVVEEIVEYEGEEEIITQLEEEKKSDIPFFTLTENEEIVEIDEVVLTEKLESEPTDTFESESNTALESEEKAEEKLQIGKPLSFQRNEKHSFQEWLQLTRIQPVLRVDVEKNEQVKTESPSVKDESPKLKKLELIDKFIETNPKIAPVKEATEPAKPIEIQDTSHLMTETLARVYLEQKKYPKAIQAYEILILKYPEKSVFFADRIRDIKKLQQNNQ
ncbi:MAG: tetratricopeptide repeat protein [Flavobacterium sp.]